MNLRESLLHAKAKGIARPKIRLNSFIFSLAPDTGKNPNAIYVVNRETGEYYGRINQDNTISLVSWFKTSTKEGTAHLIQEMIDNPEVYASAYGRMTGECCICGRTLTAKESIRNHIGPICASKYGFFYPDDEEEETNPVQGKLDIPDDF